MLDATKEFSQLSKFVSLYIKARIRLTILFSQCSSAKKEMELMSKTRYRKFVRGESRGIFGTVQFSSQTIVIALHARFQLNIFHCMYSTTTIGSSLKRTTLRHRRRVVGMQKSEGEG